MLPLFQLTTTPMWSRQPATGESAGRVAGLLSASSRPEPSATICAKLASGQRAGKIRPAMASNTVLAALCPVRSVVVPEGECLWCPNPTTGNLWRLSFDSNGVAQAAQPPIRCDNPSQAPKGSCGRPGQATMWTLKIRLTTTGKRTLTLWCAAF